MLKCDFNIPKNTSGGLLLMLPEIIRKPKVSAGIEVDSLKFV